MKWCRSFHQPCMQDEKYKDMHAIKLGQDRDKTGEAEKLDRTENRAGVEN